MAADYDVVNEKFKFFMRGFLEKIYKPGMTVDEFVDRLNANNRAVGKRELFYRTSKMAFFKSLPDVCHVDTVDGIDYIYPIQLRPLSSVAQQSPVDDEVQRKMALEAISKALLEQSDEFIGRELTLESYLEELRLLYPKSCERFCEFVEDDLDRIVLLKSLPSEAFEVKFRNGLLYFEAKKIEYCTGFPFTTAYRQDRIPLAQPIEIIVLRCETGGSRVRVYFQVKTTDKFYDDLCGFYKSTSDVSLRREEIQAGLPCAVWAEDKSRIRRAVVTEVVNTKEARLCLVDLQEFCRVPIKTLMRLDRKFWRRSPDGFEAKVDGHLWRNDRESLAEYLMDAEHVSIFPISYNKVKNCYLINCDQCIKNSKL